MIYRCPHCGTLFNFEVNNQWKPFCSERCSLIDLSDWLSDKNRISWTKLFDNEAADSGTKH